MHTIKYISKRGVLLLLLNFLSPNVLWAHSSPIPMLETSATEMRQSLQQHQTELKRHPRIAQDTVTKYLLPHVDTVGMARSVLGREAWMHASPAQRSAFTQAFVRLMIRTYARPLAAYDGDTIRFLPVRGSLDGSFTKITSVITRKNGSTLALNYSLVYKGAGWKIYDFSIEGISLIQSFRTQFAEALQKDSMEALIAHMDKTKASSAS